MSNTIPIDPAPPVRCPSVALAIGMLILSACAGEPADAADARAASDRAPWHPTGAPAQPLNRSGEEVADESRIIAMEDMEQGNEPACHITFAYEGHKPETLIWSEEPCSEVSATFLGKTELQRNNDWKRLSQYDREQFSKLPGGEVLYVSGNFAAAIYPLGYNHLTYEVAVSD